MDMLERYIGAGFDITEKDSKFRIIWSIYTRDKILDDWKKIHNKDYKENIEIVDNIEEVVDFINGFNYYYLGERPWYKPNYRNSYKKCYEITVDDLEGFLMQGLRYYVKAQS